MPFTVTHVAAVLPVARAFPKLSFSALAIGAMIPDAPIFFSLGFGYPFLHSLPGLFLGCIPLGMIAHQLYERYAKAALISLLPDFAARRLAVYSQPNLKSSFTLTALAMFLGACTHLVWDLFTHAGRWGVELVPYLQKSYSVAGYSIEGYAIVQHGSSLVFLPLLFLLFCIKTLKTKSVETSSQDRATIPSRRLTQICIVSLPIVSTMLVWILRSNSAQSFAFEVTVLSGIGFIALVAIYASGFNLRQRAE